MGKDTVRQRLRARLREKSLIVAPGIYDAYGARFVEQGFRIAIYPGLERYAAGFAIREALVTLRRDGSTKAVRDRMFTMPEYNEALRLGDIEEWEKRYLK